MKQKLNRTPTSAGLFAAALLLTTLNAQHSTVFAQSTAFTYQGRVTDNGTSFNGSGLFKFALVTSTNTSSQATASAHLSGSFVTSVSVADGECVVVGAESRRMDWSGFEVNKGACCRSTGRRQRG